MTKNSSTYRVAVVGNCQAAGIAACLERLVPGLTAEVIRLGKSSENSSMERMDRFDLVFGQNHKNRVGPFSNAELRAQGVRFVSYPFIRFAGFHPDSVTLFKPDGKALRGPAWSYQSALTVAAFLAGLAPDRVPALFNTYIFTLLGYFDVFEREKVALIASADEDGIDISGMFERWSAAGPFMHTTNHPDIRVLFDVARSAAVKAGLPVDDNAALPPDRLLAGPVLPVVEPIAKALGVPGSDLFKTDDRQVAAKQVPPKLTIAEFVESSFALLKQTDRGTLLTPRIDQTVQILEAA